MKIERGIPVPEHKARYPWADLRPGDSFFVVSADVQKARKNLSSLTVYQAKKRGWEFTTRIEKGGVRVWRTR